MAYANLTQNMTGTTNVLEIFEVVNNTLSDWPSFLFLSGVWVLIVLMVTLNTGEALKGMVGASFISTILSMIFYGNNLVGFKIPLISMGLLIITTLVLYFGGIGDG